jgi:hypothetical protein
MDCQQSIKNLNHLKNFIRAWDECYIFFFFNSETNYDIEIYDLQYSAEEKKSICICEDVIHMLILITKNLGVNNFYCTDPVDMKDVQQQFLMLIEMFKNK